MESPAPVTPPAIHPNGTDATNLEAESEYREFEQAAIRFRQQIRDRRGAAQSNA